MNYKLIILLLSLYLTSCKNVQSQNSEKNSNLIDSGIVVSAHPEASRIGIEILKKGGNAVDASVATGFALSVCYPSAGNIGGGGFMVFRFANGEIACLDFREKAPGLAGKDMFLDKNGNVIEDKSLYTHFASGVPGSVDGLITAHKKYGKLSFKEVIQPAIDLALNGFPVTRKQANSLNNSKEEFLRLNKNLPAFVKKNQEWKTGDTLKQPELAHTLELIKEQGREGFYKGETANKIIAEMKRGNGLISQIDLDNYQSIWRIPLTCNYKGHKIISMPPPSSGGVALIQLLKIIENYPIQDWKGQEEKLMHLIIEAERRVFADRSEFLADADYYNVPVNGLIDSVYLINRMKNFNPKKASISKDIKPGNPNMSESEETTHFSVADVWGNAVSVTTTLNGGYGSHIVVDGAGFLLNNEMDDFSIKPGEPNMFGLTGGKANAIEPNKRMLSSMTPTIIEKKGKLFMVVGSPGGPTIITSVFQTIINVVDKKMGMQKAVSSPRFHHQWLPDVVHIERDKFENSLIDKLSKLGHHFETRGPMGAVDAILVLTDGTYEGGADPRGDDTSAGF
jgi:gamma-glutamyltranspeptidase/glutathione hydrolase